MQIKDSHISNGITYFTPPPPTDDTAQPQQPLESADTHFPSEGMEMLYLAENKHFWHIARREFIYQEIAKLLHSFHGSESKNVSILDVGAGTGSVTRHFIANGFNNIALGEIHPQGLEYAKTYGIQNLYCMDLLDVPFSDEFDCIFAFDVLEHIDDDKCALLNMKTMLKNNPKSLLALSVPAHKWLWNAHDVSVHHKRRYTKSMLTNLMKECGFEIVAAKYFFVCITPLLWLRALLQSAPYPNDNKTAQTTPTQSNHDDNHDDNKELRDTPPPKILNSTLLGLCRLENTIQGMFPNMSALFGGSLLVVGKNANDGNVNC